MSTYRERLSQAVSHSSTPVRAGMNIRRASYSRVSVEDLMRLCQDKPDHPQARVYMRACNTDDARTVGTVVVNSVDLKALLEGRESALVMSRIMDNNVSRVLERKVLQ